MRTRVVFALIIWGLLVWAATASGVGYGFVGGSIFSAGLTFYVLNED